MSTGLQERDAFGCYTILKDKAGAPILLGEGTWGAVYKAFNGDLRCYAALRIIARDAFASDELREQFAGDVRVAASVRHRRLASVFPLGLFEEAYIYATEFCDGETAADLMARAGCLSPAAALGIATQMAAALDAASAKGLAHRNITAANIMLVQEEDEEMAAKLLDLGLPRGNRSLTPAESAGACDLRSPEEVAGEGIDARSGIFSLGALLYCMLAGVENYGVLRAGIEANRGKKPDDTEGGAPGVNGIISRTLRHDPGSRVQTFGELHELMEAALLEPGEFILAPPAPIQEAVPEVVPEQPPAEPAPAEPAPPEPQLEVKEPEPATEAEGQIAGAGSVDLRIPSELLGTAQAGTILRLKPAETVQGPAVIACARDTIRIGRAIPAADLVVRFLPRNPENDAKTKQLSKVHVTGTCENRQVLLFDGNGVRASANGSTFDQHELSASNPFLLERPGELRLADEYSIKVIPFFSKADAPAIANLGEWKGPKDEGNPEVQGAVLFVPADPIETGAAVWLFSAAQFASSSVSPLDFAAPGGEAERGVLRYYRGCFWIEQSAGDSIVVDDIPLGPGGIAPLVTGQILGIGYATYSVQVD